MWSNHVVIFYPKRESEIHVPTPTIVMRLPYYGTASMRRVKAHSHIMLHIVIVFINIILTMNTLVLDYNGHIDGFNNFYM